MKVPKLTKVNLTVPKPDAPLLDGSLSKKQNIRFRELYTCFGCETKTGVVRILVIFQGRPLLSHINGKLSG